ncbi:glycosyltransferase [Arthrobacter sp. Marseille-P9274]|uniref:glycosyltransferase n=1 Tax=Arthrobacter sp. Marseille-P9274 TaxID=2866572 RepID=UPI0021C73754|nr:glycosyltransferase [Arthrobacter sp. Marseille-P9274]
MRILHVSECYAGGVSRAIDTIAKLSSQHEHCLLWSGDDDPSKDKIYDEIFELPTSHLKRLASINKIAKLVKADIIYAHSSFAGFYCRLLPPAAPVVYEPHCFVFDDPDRSQISRWIYRAAEMLLSLNSKLVVTLTPHEEKLAKALRPGITAVQLPNVPTIVPTIVREAGDSKATSRVVCMIGRIAPQKDPGFFASLAATTAELDDSVKFVWIGDGDPIARANLERHNVTVTGWVDKTRLVELLVNSTLYFHSAKYEGFPLSVLDAAACSLPVLVRDIPCFEGFGLWSVDSVEEAAEMIIEAVNTGKLLNRIRKSSDDLLDRMNEENQIRALNEIYSRMAVYK